MGKLHGVIFPDGRVQFGEKPRPRLDIVVALPARPVDGLAEVIRDFIRENLPGDLSVSPCSEVPEEPFKLGIFADRTQPPPDCVKAGHIAYVRKDRSCILICGVMTEPYGDATMLRRRLDRGYAACLDVLAEESCGVLDNIHQMV